MTTPSFSQNIDWYEWLVWSKVLTGGDSFFHYQMIIILYRVALLGWFFRARFLKTDRSEVLQSMIRNTAERRLRLVNQTR